MQMQEAKLGPRRGRGTLPGCADFEVLGQPCANAWPYLARPQPARGPESRTGDSAERCGQEGLQSQEWNGP